MSPRCTTSRSLRHRSATAAAIALLVLLLMGPGDRPMPRAADDAREWLRTAGDVAEEWWDSVAHAWDMVAQSVRLLARIGAELSPAPDRGSRGASQGSAVG